MQIQLKQMEIEAALKGYISQQGISLANKEITISFTAGRKESGISADLTINDSEIPGDSETAFHTSVVVIPPGCLREVSKIDPVPVILAGQSEDPLCDPEVSEDAPIKTTSLFG